MFARCASALAAFILIAPCFAQDVEPPRLRTLLPNGSTVLVDNMPSAKVMSVQLFASSIRFPDTPENHGYKHLLEHLLLKGPDKRLDMRMESQGIFFTGRTLRDAMQIEFTCAPGQIKTVLDALAVLMQPLRTTQSEIDKELKIMAQEKALQEDSQRLSAAAWSLAYGDRGLSPFGDLTVMAGATPEALQAYQQLLFNANNLVLVICGPLNVETETKVAAAFLKEYPGTPGDEPLPMPDGVPGRVEVEDSFGEARAARVGGFKEDNTAYVLAAALGLATQLGPVFVTYTPSAANGLIILGKTDTNNGVGLKLDELEPGDLAGLYPVGKSLARRWIERQLENPSSCAGLRGLLLCQGPSYTPESMLKAIDGMSWQEFSQAVTAFGKDRADIVVGVR